MYPVESSLSHLEIYKVFLEKSANFRENAITFYTDGSKLDKNSPSGAAVFSPEFNLHIAHKLPPETSVFTAEA